MLEALAKQKKVYTATYKRGVKPSVVVRLVLHGCCLVEKKPNAATI